MIVSFDLDDTLFIDPRTIAAEPPLHFPCSRIYKERLRLGTPALFHRIQESGIGLWIYTSSFRSERYIRAYFRHCGIRVDEIVNGARHEREVQAARREPLPSKYPARYKIDLHVDDDPSVAQNGRIYGFEVVLVGGDEPAWHERVWAQIQRRQHRLSASAVQRPR